MVKLKSNKGNTGVDIVISIGIISITLTILASLYFSLYIANIEIERKTQAISYGTQILEKVSEYYYADVTQENFQPVTLANGNKQIAGVQLAKGYNASVNISEINSQNSISILKRVEVTIEYNVSKKTHTLTLSKNKAKEKLKVPNFPELTEDLIPIKVQRDNNKSVYKVTNTTDEYWYNYNSKKWALATEKQKINSTISTEDLYVWIPRYAYNPQNNDIKFLYGEKNQIVDSSGNLQNISNNYVVDNKFTNEDARGYWVKVYEVITDETATTLNNSDYGKFIY